MTDPQGRAIPPLVEQAVQQVREATWQSLQAAVAASDRELELLDEAAADFLGRMPAAAQAIRASLDARDREAAARWAAQLAALARMAADRLRTASDRQRAALEAVAAVIDSLPDRESGQRARRRVRTQREAGRG